MREISQDNSFVFLLSSGQCQKSSNSTVSTILPLFSAFDMAMLLSCRQLPESDIHFLTNHIIIFSSSSFVSRVHNSLYNFGNILDIIVTSIWRIMWIFFIQNLNIFKILVISNGLIFFVFNNYFEKIGIEIV